MEIVVIVLLCIGGIAAILAIVNLFHAEWRAALICFGIAGCTGLLLPWLNGMLVQNNKTPVSDKMQVTTVTQTYDGSTTIYRTSFNNISFMSAVVCEDGESLKCADLKLGDTIVLQKWKDDGWTWRFQPTERA